MNQKRKWLFIFAIVLGVFFIVFNANKVQAESVENPDAYRTSELYYGGERYECPICHNDNSYYYCEEYRNDQYHYMYCPTCHVRKVSKSNANSDVHHTTINHKSTQVDGNRPGPSTGVCSMCESDWTNFPYNPIVVPTASSYPQPTSSPNTETTAICIRCNTKLKGNAIYAGKENHSLKCSNCGLVNYTEHTDYTYSMSNKKANDYTTSVHIISFYCCKDENGSRVNELEGCTFDECVYKNDKQHILRCSKCKVEFEQNHVFDKDGNCTLCKKNGEWKQYGTEWYYYDENGELATGWRYLEWEGKSFWYYFATSNNQFDGYKIGQMVTGEKLIDGYRYYFCEMRDNPSGYFVGARVENEWIGLNYYDREGKWTKTKTPVPTSTYEPLPTTTEKITPTPTQSREYCADGEHMWGEWVADVVKDHTFIHKRTCLKCGYIESHECDYNFISWTNGINSNGEFVHFKACEYLDFFIKGLCNDSNEDGLCDTCGGSVIIPKNGWVRHYKFGWYYYKDGQKITGWSEIDGYWYYFDDSTCVTKREFQNITWEGKEYTFYFDPDSCKMVTGEQIIDSKTYYFCEETGKPEGYVKGALVNISTPMPTATPDIIPTATPTPTPTPTQKRNDEVCNHEEYVINCDHVAHWKLCKKCGEIFDSLLHDGYEVNCYDIKSHWQVCSICGIIIENSADVHSYIQGTDSNGKKIRKCSKCKWPGEEIDENGNPLNSNVCAENEHDFQMAKDTVAHWKVCVKCSKVQKGSEELHAWGNIITENGSQWQNCTVCGATHIIEGNHFILRTTSGNNTLGVSVRSLYGILPEEAEINTRIVTKGDIYNIFYDNLKDENEGFEVIELDLAYYGEDITPNGNVQITIPVPEGYYKNELCLYGIDENNMKIVKYYPSVVNDNICFDTDNVSSYFAITAKKIGDLQITDIPTEKTVNQNDTQFPTGIIIAICGVVIAIIGFIAIKLFKVKTKVI